MGTGFCWFLQVSDIMILEHFLYYFSVPSNMSRESLDRRNHFPVGLLPFPHRHMQTPVNLLDLRKGQSESCRETGNIVCAPESLPFFKGKGALSPPRGLLLDKWGVAQQGTAKGAHGSSLPLSGLWGWGNPALAANTSSCTSPQNSVLLGFEEVQTPTKIFQNQANSFLFHCQNKRVFVWGRRLTFM